MGALTSKPYAFRARPWELENNYNFWFYDSIFYNININILNLNIERILPRYINELNLSFIPDSVRFFINKSRVLSKVIFPLIKFKKKSNYFTKIIWPFFYYFNFNYLITANLLLKKINIFEKLSNNLDILDIINIKNQKMYFGTYKNAIITLYNNYNNYYNYYFLSYFNNYVNQEINKKFNIFFINFNPRIDSPILNLYLERLKKKFKIIVYSINNNIFYKEKKLNIELNTKGLFKINKGKSILNLFYMEKEKFKIFFVNENTKIIFQNLKNTIINIVYSHNNFFHYLKIIKSYMKYSNMLFRVFNSNSKINIYNLYNFDLYTKIMINHVVNNEDTDIKSIFLLTGILDKNVFKNIDFILPCSYFLERCFFGFSLFYKVIFTKKIIENFSLNLDILDLFYFFQKKKKIKLLEYKKQINSTFYNLGFFFYFSNKVTKTYNFIKNKTVNINYIIEYYNIVNTNYIKGLNNEIQTYINNQY